MLIRVTLRLPCLRLISALSSRRVSSGPQHAAMKEKWAGSGFDGLFISATYRVTR